MINKKARVLYLHSGLRLYRVGLFKLLSKKFDIDFFFSENIKKDRHVIEETNRLVNESQINIIQAKEIESLPIYGFSFQLFTLPFKKYDVVILTSSVSVPFLILSPLFKVTGKKVILFDELWRYPKEINKYKIIYPYVKFLLKYCVDNVITSGSKSKELYLNEYLFKKRIGIAYNTTVDLLKFEIDEEQENNISNKLNITTKKKRILYLARVIDIKGLDILIKAMLKVSSDYELIVVGDGEFLSKCKKLAEDLQLKNRVHFLGDCLSSETVYYYKNCDIYVLPTKKQLNMNVQVESWGFTINEAMSLELPVVTTTAVGSSYDLVIDGYNGAIAEESSSDSLSEKINFVIENNKNNIMGKNARRHLNEVCSYYSNLNVYEESINS